MIISEPDQPRTDDLLHCDQPLVRAQVLKSSPLRECVEHAQVIGPDGVPRFAELGVIAKLQQDFPDIGDSPDPRTVFLKLRELRNSL